LTARGKALLDKGRRSLGVARQLLDGGHSDFASSRAYYAMFYAAEALLLEKGLAFSKHSALISAFGRHFAKTGAVPAELHRYLLDAEDLRIIGDYDTEFGASAEQVRRTLERAEEFLRIAGEILDSVPPDLA
jgi:uncharacterized protein (UPF0332 family)